MRTIRNIAFLVMVALGIAQSQARVDAWAWCQYESCSSMSLYCDFYCAPDVQYYEYSSCWQEDDNYGGMWTCYDCWCQVTN